MDKLSYALGIGIGTQLRGMGATNLNIDDFAQAIKDAIAGKKLKVDNKEAQTLVNNFFAEQQARKEAATAEAGRAAKAVGEDFLAENAKKDNIVVLPSGLQYEVIREGNGNKQGEVPLRGYAHRRNQVRQFVRPWRTGYVWAEPGNRRLDRRLATYERRSQISLLHTLQLRLRRTWRRCFNTSIRSIGV